MLSNSAGSHNTTTAPTGGGIRGVTADLADLLGRLLGRLRLVRARAERLELPLELGERARQLLTPCRMRRRFKLPAELGEREAKRFGPSQLLRVTIALRHRAPSPFFVPLVHAFLNAILCVDKAFTCVSHLHLLCYTLPATTYRLSSYQ